ncbi:AN1-type zinc finger domain-containing protein [Dactylosporangium vinaceum]|uniref:AN1-type zinc finger domain-containing protein n=1 Tax=Dactylosporangium vinaceum TaxID=53362 RepID=A0ABV5MF89_9ACTN|nr:AN1-type zinc finger domain-containing protein [Dactylosporangium vinaceum]UAB98680.1 AN1-type zinc finger domain-containing protein [Dactylosporangium vinaceum]
MAAECAIDGCAVLAIGRCRECGRAFCMSHQAHNEVTGEGYAALCIQCLQRRQRVAGAADPKVDGREAAERTWVTSGQAAMDLYAAGIAPVPVVERRSRFVKQRFGRPREEIDEIEVGALWVIGRFEWTEMQEIPETREWNTGLLVRPSGGYPVAMVARAVARCKVTDGLATLIRDARYGDSFTQLERREIPRIIAAIRALVRSTTGDVPAP